MLYEVIKSDSLVELSIEEQQHLSGGQCFGRRPESPERPGELPPGYDKYVYHHVDVFPQSGSPSQGGGFDFGGGQNDFGGGNPGGGNPGGSCSRR
jgi:hypothetical protein